MFGAAWKLSPLLLLPLPCIIQRRYFHKPRSYIVYYSYISHIFCFLTVYLCVHFSVLARFVLELLSESISVWYFYTQSQPGNSITLWNVRCTMGSGKLNLNYSGLSWKLKGIYLVSFVFFSNLVSYVFDICSIPIPIILALKELSLNKVASTKFQTGKCRLPNSISLEWRKTIKFPLLSFSRFFYSSQNYTHLGSPFLFDQNKNSVCMVSCKQFHKQRRHMCTWNKLNIMSLSEDTHERSRYEV